MLPLVKGVVSSWFRRSYMRLKPDRLKQEFDREFILTKTFNGEATYAL